MFTAEHVAPRRQVIKLIMQKTQGNEYIINDDSCLIRGRHGGVEKRGGWKTSRMTSLPKIGFGAPLVRYVFHPPQVSVLCFSCTKIHDRADQKLFWRGPKIFGRARSLVRFPPPIHVADPPITAQLKTSKVEASNSMRQRNKKCLYLRPQSGVWGSIWTGNFVPPPWLSRVHV